MAFAEPIIVVLGPWSGAKAAVAGVPQGGPYGWALDSGSTAR
jgi:hypothetical protein